VSDLYVLEWSKKQGMPNVQRLEETLSNNRKAYRDDMVANDYIPIAIGSFDEMIDAAEGMRPTLIARRPEKSDVLCL